MHLLFNNEIPEVSDEHLWKRNMDIFLSIHTVTFTFDSLEQQCLAVKLYNDLYYLTRYT